MYKTLILALSIAGLSISSYAQKRVPDLILYEYEADSGTAISSYGKYVALIFISDNCAYVESYVNRINQLDTKNKGIKFLIVNVGPKSKYKFKSAVIDDKDKKTAKVFHISRAPEVVLLKDLTIVYQGAIDDNPLLATDVRNHFLQQAIDDVKKNGKVTKEKQKAFGCVIIH